LWFLSLLRRHNTFVNENFNRTAGWLFSLAAIALSIKLFLQLGSVIPSLSDLSYGFRPIIIGYLHLVLLGVITIFILGMMVADGHISITKLTITGIITLTTGIIVNEIMLMVQGVTAMNYSGIPFINEILFITALVMFTGLATINFSQQIKK
jgi:hypothetical protein